MRGPILITGGNGFLGAWVARRLGARGLELRILDRIEDRSVVSAIAGPEIAASAEWRVGDIADGPAVADAAAGCGGIVHLAGILTPACRADPLLGASVNLIGTLHVFEAACRHGIERVVYTSSAAVFGPEDGRVPHPGTHYGAFKLACEGSARAYHEDRGLASVGFRPYVVYGPGRTTGLTAGPTLACRAAARGQAYTIPYRGVAGLVFADDVAAAYERALERPPAGAGVYNLSGTAASAEDVARAIRDLMPGARIDVDGPELPFTPDIPEGDLRDVFPGLPATSLRDGLARTIAYYADPANP
ncbi:MAG TPA: SDR family oxidoreductase [Salinarimonas sp.]|nr:SDR family oxidoreductase [Salinarimonas sp.]